jgi:hypothetical protein
MNNLSLFEEAVEYEEEHVEPLDVMKVNLLAFYDYFHEDFSPLTFGENIQEGESFDDSDPSHWSAEDVDFFLDQYLKTILSVFCRPGHGQEKYAALCWIADDVNEGGLSFNVVCGGAGYDPDVIRDGFKKLLKGIGFTYSSRFDDYNRIVLGPLGDALAEQDSEFRDHLKEKHINARPRTRHEKRKYERNQALF